MTNEPIIIEDNGRGMSREELESEYLNIASNRRMRHGDFSLTKMRKVKGSKGIGKFAGFMLATTMKIETWVMGIRYELQFSTSSLDLYPDLHEIPINVLSIEDNSKKSGTRITLTDLCRHIGFPSPESLRQLLIQEYGREADFSLTINGKNSMLMIFKGFSSNKRLIFLRWVKLGYVLLYPIKKALLENPEL